MLFNMTVTSVDGEVALFFSIHKEGKGSCGRKKDFLMVLVL